jgi:hypothetical protein
MFVIGVNEILAAKRIDKQRKELSVLYGRPYAIPRYEDS